jgi:large subunit ribosomal protein L22
MESTTTQKPVAETKVPAPQKEMEAPAQQEETKAPEQKEMKSTTVILRHLRIAPRKVRLVVDLIRSMPVNEAEAQLMIINKRSSQPILKLLRSGIASAKEKEMDLESLVISEARVDKGPILKRWMPRAMGRATPIHKITSHIILTLQESEKSVSSRFVTQTVIKTKKEEKKEQREQKHEHEHEEEKKRAPGELPKQTSEKKGLARKLFRRKNI